MIYADNAATTALDKEAYESMIPWLTNEYGNPSQPYSFSRAPKKAISEARETIASLINANPEEIYFTSGGTESDNWAIKGTAFLYDDKKTIITSEIEHHAVLNTCASLEKKGFLIKYAQPDSKGVILPNTFKQLITKDSFLASIMYSNNEIGTIEPIKELANISHDYGLLFHTDAVQAVGHVQIDVKDLGIDMLSASAHKFNGPKGVGFLFLRNGSVISPHNDGGSQEFNLRAGTENVAGIVGMAIALKNNYKHLRRNKEHIQFLEERLLSGISGLDYIRNGADDHIPGNINLSFKNMDGENILHRLDLKGICISTGSACDSANTQVSHVIRAINVQEGYSEGTIRISLGKDNTVEEVDEIAFALNQIIE